MAEQLAGSYLRGRIGALADNDAFSGGLMLVLVGMVAAYMSRAAQWLWDRFWREFVVSLEVRKEDEAFAWIMKWLAHQTERANGRDLSMLTTRDNRQDRWNGAEAATKPQLHFGPAPGQHFLRYRERWITVRRVVKENGGNNRLKETIKLQTFGRDPQVLKDLAADAIAFALGDEMGKVVLFQPQLNCFPVGSWRKLMAVERRAIASVHFPEGVVEELVADVREFLAMGEWYKRRGIPHRRGYMLYGEPGCGKSSFATALAGELGLNLCVCSLASARLDDDSLQEFLRKMPKGSILLLEDIDAAFIQRTKNVDQSHSKNKVTFSGLLNALDGAVAFEGSLVLMTTNHRELLDPALTRPGRVDMAIYVGLARRDQVRRLFAYFYHPWEAQKNERDDDSEDDKKNEDDSKRRLAEVDQLARRFAELVPEERLSMASLQGFLLRHKLDPQAAIDNVERFVEAELDRVKEAARHKNKKAADSNDGLQANKEETIKKEETKSKDSATYKEKGVEPPSKENSEDYVTSAAISAA
jgi:DNA polymerase III delta prime subunit